MGSSRADLPDMVVGYDLAVKEGGYTAITIAMIRQGHANVVYSHAAEHGTISRLDMLTKIVELAREYTPKTLSMQLANTEKPQAISQPTLKQIVEGDLDAKDLLVGS